MVAIRSNTTTESSPYPLILADDSTTSAYGKILAKQQSEPKFVFESTQHSTTIVLLGSGSAVYRIELYQLKTLALSTPISISLEFDQVHYLAQCIDLPIYAVGDTYAQALNNLKEHLEDLISELNEDDKLSEEWKRYKMYLKNRIA